MKSWKPNTRQIEREREKPDACLYFWKNGFWRVFFETSLAPAKVKVSPRIACHFWRVLGADSFALSYLVKTRGGRYHWRARGDLVTDLFTELREAITRKVQKHTHPPLPEKPSSFVQRKLFLSKKTGGNRKYKPEEKNKYPFQKYINSNSQNYSTSHLYLMLLTVYFKLK